MSYTQDIHSPSFRLRVAIRAINPDAVLAEMANGADPYEASEVDGKTAVDLAADYGFCGFVSAPGLSSDFTKKCEQALTEVFSKSPKTEKDKEVLQKCLTLFEAHAVFQNKRLADLNKYAPEKDPDFFVKARKEASEHVLQIVKSSPAMAFIVNDKAPEAQEKSKVKFK